MQIFNIFGFFTVIICGESPLQSDTVTSIILYMGMC